MPENDRGMGFVGVEWRNLILRRNLDETEYKTGMNMKDYLFTPEYTALGALGPMPWIDYHFVDTMPTLAVDKTSSAYDSLISDYRYRETTITPMPRCTTGRTALRSSGGCASIIRALPPIPLMSRAGRLPAWRATMAAMISCCPRSRPSTSWPGARS
jgi:hypothetical protein